MPVDFIDDLAPGAPGIAARWTSSAKNGVGTAIEAASRVWFTLSHGIVNEIYFPRIDQACVRDLGLLITGDDGFFSEEKRDATCTIAWDAPGVPAFTLTNRCSQGRYRIEKQVVTDPARDSLLQKITFVAGGGARAGFRLFVLLAPHLGNHGSGNDGWVGDRGGTPMLFAQRLGSALALACSAPLLGRSAGYVGVSDGYSDVAAHHRMAWQYRRAVQGNIALTAEIDLVQAQGAFVLALGFGSDAERAADNAAASLSRGFEAVRRDYIAGWQDWITRHTRLAALAAPLGSLAHHSIAVLKTHAAKNPPGGMIASLSIPWGASKGDNDLGGYHLVWSRDMVETAGGLLAAGAFAEARQVLKFLQATQLPDGHWSQNMWLDGSPYWNGIQMDETALPILLVDLAYREGALARADLPALWPMVQRAAGYLVRNGPVSPQDRWEEDAGYSPFTIAAEIAGLLAAADLAEDAGEATMAGYLREIADVWHDEIDRWMYASGTALAQAHGVPGYYVRIAPTEGADGGSRFAAKVAVKNVAASLGSCAAGELVSPDALALVRFGLREAGDPRMLDTVTVIDAVLKIETPQGETWHRYNGDGYGEHADGAPFDGTGIGRGWPLLTGERAHYALAAGDLAAARGLGEAMTRFAGDGGLIPEQVWDAPDLPERELWRGRPSGSAMPLVWAHAEYLKLLRSIADRRVFDLPPQTVQRYLTQRTVSPHRVWRFNHRITRIAAGKILRIETAEPTVVHWSTDGWATTRDTVASDPGFGLFTADLTPKPGATLLLFTLYWPNVDRWEGKDFPIEIG